ncbi:MAG: outer membrane beta-barrel protein [Candidatus Zixiibacteriota bacterium]
MNVSGNLGGRVMLGVLIALSASAGSVGARDLRGFDVTPFTGYQFGGKFTTYSGDLNVVDSENYGVFVDIPVNRRGYKAEILYSRQDTIFELRTRPPNRVTRYLFDMSVEYYNVGAVYEKPKGDVRPYGVVTLGGMYANPKGSNWRDEWFFNITFGGGAKAYLTKHVGLRADLRALAPMHFAGTGLWVGTGGVDFGLAAGSVITQGNISLGLMINW